MMKHILILSAALLCLVSCRNDIADTMHADPETPVIANDISNQKVTSFAEDEHGHIWMGTFRGLNRYDVHEFHQHFCTDDTLSLPDNQIQQIMKDSRNRLWISTVNGMALYTDKDNFRRIRMNTYSRNAFQILEDKSGNIYVNTSAALCRYDEEENAFNDVLQMTEAGWSMIMNCFFSPGNDLWVVTSTHLKRYETDSMQLLDSLQIDNYPTYSYMTRDGRIWLSTYAGVSVFDTGSRSFQKTPESMRNHPEFSRAYVTYIYQYGDNTLLLNTDKHGLFCYNMVDGSLKHQSETGFPFIVPDVKINVMFADSRRNLWIGSYDQGFHVIYDYKERFNNDSWLKSNLENVSVMSVACDSRDNLWISTLKDGLYLYNSKTEIFRRIDRSRLFRFDGGDKQDVSFVFVDSRDRVWLTIGNAVVRCLFDGKDLKVDRYWPVFLPMAMSEDAQGRVWIGSASEYVHYVSDVDDELHSLKSVSSYFTFIPYVLPLSDGRMLSAAFNEGFSEIDGEAGLVHQIRFDDEVWNNAVRRSVIVPTCMYQDDEGTVWVGTIANGLLKYIPSTGELLPVPGAPCSDISAIEEDLHGNLWVSTQYGLGKYDRSVGKFINWYATDGIGGNQFYDRSSCRLSDGTLVFGGTHGLTFFNPMDVVNTREIALKFEDLKVHNRLMRPGIDGCIDKALPFNPDIRLRNDQNSFSISFAALDYGEYERVDYSYMLEGFDRHWIDAHNNREAHYSNLPFGRYTFRVKVSNDDKTYDLAENAITVIMEPPLWLSWWAVLLYVMALSLVALIVVRVRSQMIREKMDRLNALQEKEHEKKVNQMNMSFFANISHEFRTPLTMISGPVTQLLDSDGLTVENKRLLNIVQRNIRRMLRLVNQLLDFNKLENDTLKLQVKPLDIVLQLNNLTDIFKVTCDEKGVVFKRYGLEDSLTVWADDDKLDKICFNLLSNAVKFTPAGGKVEFSFDVISREEASLLFELTEADKDSRYVKILVKDSGQGIPENQKERIFERYYQLENQMRGAYNWGTGIGLYFAKTLAHMHHGYLKAGNRTSGEGAVFTLILPVSESSYSEMEKCREECSGQSPFKISSVKYTDQLSVPAGEDRRTVLVVDDDADVVHYLKELLSPYYNVICRFDVDSAYVVMKEEAPDVILSDVVMPGKTGYDLCRKVKDNIQLSHIPVILLTAKATVEDQVQGLGCGADAYVTKPFEPQYLLALIDSQLRNREKVRAMLSSSTAVDNLEGDVLSPQDNVFMNELYQLMENELANSELDVTRMTELMHISRTKFYYKVKGLTGENPSVFFKRYKLNRAAELLRERKYNVSEIADMTGFSTLSHFSTSFKKQFGVSPSEYVK